MMFIRDMALWIARDCEVSPHKWMVNVKLALREAPQELRRWTDAHKVSLMFNEDITTLPATINAGCPNLTTLILSDAKIGRDGETLTPSFQFFLNLRYLDLSSCNFKEFPIEICSMTALEYLSLSNNPIRSLPEDLRSLKKLKYFIMRQTFVVNMPKGIIPNLTNLVVLDVNSGVSINQESIIQQLHHTHPKSIKAIGINAASISQVQKLTTLPITRLYLHTMEGVRSLSLLSSQLLGHPNVQGTLRRLYLKDSKSLEELRIEGHHPPLEWLETLQLLFLPYLKEIVWKAVANMNLFPRVTCINIFSCGKLKHATWILHLPSLEILDIQHCNEMEEVINEEIAAAEMELSTGEEIRPTRVNSLKGITLAANKNLACISTTCAFYLSFA